MQLRFVLRGSLVTITVVAAGACVVSGSLWMAGGLTICAMAIAAIPLANAVARDELKSLLESLRLAQRSSAVPVNAVVTSTIIFIAKSAISDASSNGYALLFRDEMDVAIWRELATLLRHQTHPLPELKKVDQAKAYPLGKSSDL